MNNFFEKIFVINLDRCADRRLYIEKIMSDSNIKFEFIEAVDGNKLLPNQESWSDWCNSNTLKCRKGLPCDYWLPNHGQIGCYLSHVKIWKKIIEEKIESCLILEDDIVLKLENFNDYSNALPEDWNIFMLGWSGGITNEVNDKIVQLWSPSSTYAYALKNQSAEILLKYHWPMKGALDAFTGAIFFSGNSTSQARDYFIEWYEKHSCNPHSLDIPKIDIDEISNLKAYAARDPLINHGGSNYSTT